MGSVSESGRACLALGVGGRLPRGEEARILCRHFPAAGRGLVASPPSLFIRLEKRDSSSTSRDRGVF